MREIKFQIYWIAGHEMLYDTNSDLEFRDKENYWITDLSDATNHPERYKVRQYTGLKDKDGIEIYEGDIVKGWRNEIYTVAFVEKRGGYYPFAQGDGCGCCDDEVEYDSTECKVLGNCYENPELSQG